MTGLVLRVGVKGLVPGEAGLPKPETDSARLTARGFEGDYNRYRQEKKGGTPDMAVLVMPVETLRQLAAEGWPVAPGDIGENITSSGLAYADFAPGKRFKVGEAVIEISMTCDPCSTLGGLPYVGPAKLAAFVKTMMGRRGWYARVVVEGLVRKGDAIAPLG